MYNFVQVITSFKGSDLVIEIINESINDRFFNLVSDSKQVIRLCAPYVKESIVNKIYDNKKPSVKIDLISNFSLTNFYKRSVIILSLLI